MVGSCDVKFPIRLEGLVLTHGQFSRYRNVVCFVVAVGVCGWLKGLDGPKSLKRVVYASYAGLVLIAVVPSFLTLFCKTAVLVSIPSLQIVVYLSSCNNTQYLHHCCTLSMKLISNTHGHVQEKCCNWCNVNSYWIKNNRGLITNCSHLCKMLYELIAFTVLWHHCWMTCLLSCIFFCQQKMLVHSGVVTDVRFWQYSTSDITISKCKM